MTAIAYLLMGAGIVLAIGSLTQAVRDVAAAVREATAAGIDESRARANRAARWQG